MSTDIILVGQQGPPGPSSVSATTANVGPTLNVKQFGALGDGIHDDTTAINNACTSLQQISSSCPGTLHFPAGTYLHSGWNISNMAGLRVVGEGAYAVPTGGMTSTSLGLTVIRALGTQSYVLRNASPFTHFEGITFDGAFKTTDAVLKLDYFTTMSRFVSCAFVHPSYNSSSPQLGGNIVAIGEDVNLEIDNTEFVNCVIRAFPEGGSYKANRGIYCAASNAYLIAFRKCYIGDCYDNVYIKAGGLNFYNCDFENASDAHIVFDFSAATPGMSPTWIVDCFTETAVPWVKDINTSTTQDFRFGELYLVSNFTSTYPNMTLSCLRNVHINGGRYGNITILANAANGGSGSSWIRAANISFPDSADFSGAGVATNLSEIGTVLQPNAGPNTIRNRIQGNTTFYSTIVSSSMTAPGTPPAGQFYVYMDSADNKLKCKGPSGTVTVLGLP